MRLAHVQDILCKSHSDNRVEISVWCSPDWTNSYNLSQIVASFQGSPLALTKNKNYFSLGRGESLGTRQAKLIVYQTERGGGAYNGVRGMMEVVDFLADRLGDETAGTLVSLLHQRLMFPHHDEHTQG